MKEIGQEIKREIERESDIKWKIVEYNREGDSTYIKLKTDEFNVLENGEIVLRKMEFK
jgi:hypothetical protein